MMAESRHVRDSYATSAQVAVGLERDGDGDEAAERAIEEALELNRRLRAMMEEAGAAWACARKAVRSDVLECGCAAAVLVGDCAVAVGSSHMR
jgi:hypothetical protein